jgi:hypothetical protein
MRCTDGTAYATVVSYHDHPTGVCIGPASNRCLPSTAGTSALHKTRSTSVMGPQLQLATVLVRSVRRVERCRRDFVLLLGGEASRHIERSESATRQLRSLQERGGVMTRVVAPIIRGVPSTDKLHAWLLTNYSRILVLDSDTLVLRSLDYLFALPEPLVIAHHATDIVQLVCGIPTERRSMSSLFVMQPGDATYAALEKAVVRQNRFLLTHYSEQILTACFFANVSRTLPSTVAYSFGSCASINVANCRHWFNTTIMRASGSRRHAALSDSTAHEECLAMKRHSCSLPEGAALMAKTRVIHMKGTHKPWVLAKECLPAKLGALRAVGERKLNASEWIEWRESTCGSLTDLSPVRWADGGVVTRACCVHAVLISATWHGVLLTDGSAQWGGHGPGSTRAGRHSEKKRAGASEHGASVPRKTNWSALFYQGSGQIR